MRIPLMGSAPSGRLPVLAAFDDDDAAAACCDDGWAPGSCGGGWDDISLVRSFSCGSQISILLAQWWTVGIESRRRVGCVCEETATATMGLLRVETEECLVPTTRP